MSGHQLALKSLIQLAQSPAIQCKECTKATKGDSPLRPHLDSKSLKGPY